jgi:hypothetical protein
MADTPSRAAETGASCGTGANPRTPLSCSCHGTLKTG